MKKKALLLSVIALLFAFCSLGYAEVVHFNVPSEEYETLQDALDKAVSADKDYIITLAGGDYAVSGDGFNYSGDLAKANSLVIKGEDGAEVTLDGGEAVRVLYISTDNTDITLQNLTIQNAVPTDTGKKPAALIVESGDLNVENCNFINNKMKQSSALWLEIIINGTINVNGDCEFKGNIQELDYYYTGGSAIFAVLRKNGTINIQDNLFEGNKMDGEGTRGGGAVYAWVEGIGDINFNRNIFTENSGYKGGAISVKVDGAGDVNLGNNEFTGNVASNDNGGGFYADVETGDITIEKCTFSENSADSKGGAGILKTSSGNILVKDSVFEKNQAAQCGGIHADVSVGDVTVENCTFNKNIGGGIFTSQEDGKLIIRNNLITDNISEFAGGIMVALDENSKSYIVNNTITGNVATDVDPFVGGFGAMIYEENSECHLYNNIIWGNTAQDGKGNDIYFSGGPDNFVVRDNDFSVLSADFTISSGLYEPYNLNVDPGFVSSTDFRLQEGSPVIDMGNSLTDIEGIELPELDLAGNARVHGSAVDMGAYEYGTGDDDTPKSTSGGSSGCNAGAFSPALIMLFAPLLLLAGKR